MIYYVPDERNNKIISFVTENAKQGCETVYECCGKDLQSPGCEAVCKKCGKCQTNSELVVKIDYLMNIYQYITHDASEIIKILLSNKNTKCWHLNTGLED